MSCALTSEQVRAKIKTVTRRLGWRDLKPGEQLQLCEKCMGRKPGEPLVKLAVVEIVGVRRESIGLMETSAVYGRAEASKEGFPHLSGAEFVAFFLSEMTHETDAEGKRVPTTRATIVTRIEWRYVETAE
jgi:hypothetical protein